MRERVFIDTSAFYAIASKEDANHPAAIKVYGRLLDESTVFVLTDCILSEAATLLRRRLGYKQALEFIDSVEEGAGIGLFDLIVTTKADLMQARKIFADEKDPKLSFADAVSIAIIKKEKIKKVFAFDAHFTPYGLLKA